MCNVELECLKMRRVESDMNRIGIKQKIILFIILIMLLVNSGSRYAYAATITIRYRITITTTVGGSNGKRKNNASLERKKITLHKGDKYKLCLDGASKKVKWFTPNKKIISLKKKGDTVIITAKKTGKAKVIAKYKGKKYTCKVKVVKGKGKYVTLSDYGTISFEENGSSEETITVKTSQDCRVTYKVKNPKLVKCKWGEVSNGPAESGFGKERTLVISLAKTAYTGKTSIVIKNSKNPSEVDVIPIEVQMLLNEGVSEYVLVPDDSKSIELKEGITDSKSINIRTSSHCDLSYEVQNPELVNCELYEGTTTDSTDGYDRDASLLVSISPTASNGSTKVIIKNTKNKKEIDVIDVAVKVRKNTITNDIENNKKALLQYLEQNGKIEKRFSYNYMDCDLTIEKNGSDVLCSLNQDDSWMYSKASMNLLTDPVAVNVTFSYKDTGSGYAIKRYTASANIPKVACVKNSNIQFNILSNSDFSETEIQTGCNETLGLLLEACNSVLPKFPNYVGDEVNDYTKMSIQNIGFTSYPNVALFL